MPAVGAETPLASLLCVPIFGAASVRSGGMVNGVVAAAIFPSVRVSLCAKARGALRSRSELLSYLAIKRASAALFGNETKGAAMADDRPPYPPFTMETATQRCRPLRTRGTPATLSGWPGLHGRLGWRNRDVFVSGRDEIVAFLTQKWERELDYALRKNLWRFEGNRIAVRFQYECRDREAVVAQLRQREVEVRRARADGPPRGEHQRRADRRERAADCRAAAGGGPREGVPAALTLTT